MFRSYDDERGSLTPVEFKDIPFKPKRLFYIRNVPAGLWRGGHAHYKTVQMLICVKGSIDYRLFDGKKEKCGTLKENDSVLVEKLVWDMQKFNSVDSILLVLCNTYYSEEDYIRNLSDFLIITKSEKSIAPCKACHENFWI